MFHFLLLFFSFATVFFPCLATSSIRNKFDRVRHLRADEGANERAFLRVETFPALPSSGQDSKASDSVCGADNPSVQVASSLPHSHGSVPKTKDCPSRARKEFTNVCLVFPKEIHAFNVYLISLSQSKHAGASGTIVPTSPSLVDLRIS